MNWIKANCVTNIAIYSYTEWPTTFSAMPSKGEYVRSLCGKSALEIVAVYHTSSTSYEEPAGRYVERPRVEIELGIQNTSLEPYDPIAYDVGATYDLGDIIKVTPMAKCPERAFLSMGEVEKGFSELMPHIDGTYITINRFSVIGPAEFMCNQWYKDGIEVRVIGWKKPD